MALGCLDEDEEVDTSRTFGAGVKEGYIGTAES